jgi:hypothetical protein
VNWLVFGILLGLLAVLTWMLTVIGPDAAWDCTLLGWAIDLFLVSTSKALKVLVA